MKRANMIGTLIVVTMILGIAGCQMFENSPTDISVLDATAAATSNFIMGEPELTTWGAYYVKDDSFLRVDLPVSGAIKVEYSVARGWTGAVFIRTDAPVGLEIGLITIDGETDVVENVCVTYAEGGTFSAIPEEAQESFQDTDETWIHYTRVMNDGSTRDWWPATADFEFSGETTSTCAVEDGEVRWDVIPGGAFEKPTSGAGITETGITEIHLWRTDSTTNGAIGNRDAANAFCQRDANMPAADNTAVAVLSYRDDEAYELFTGPLALLPVVRPDGAIVAEAGWAGLWDGALDAAVSEVAGEYVQTGTDARGRLGDNCREWTSASRRDVKHVGQAWAQTANWVNSTQHRCRGKSRVYCASY